MTASFETLGLSPWLGKQCQYLALKEPTPIQARCVPSVLAGNNVVGVAATGSGKTAAFALPMLHILSEDMYGVFALVLTPSRELAYQIVDQFIAFGAPLKLRTMLAIGGVRHEEQVDSIKARPHVVVATPGRLRFLLEKFTQEVARAFAHLRFLVLDEADRLTDGDLQHDVMELLRLLPPTPRRQTLLFTATIHPRLQSLTPPPGQAAVLAALGITNESKLDVVLSTESQWSTSTISADISGDSKDAEASPSTAVEPLYRVPQTLQQLYIFIPEMVKLQNLVASLRGLGKEQMTIVFTNSCQRAEVVRLSLQLLGFPVCSLDALLTQQHRLDNLALFKLGIARIMVATDIASRGLDIPAVGMVIHYDVPKHAETYVHRVGRTSRAGKEGTSVAFVTQYDVELVHRLEKKLSTKLQKWRNPHLRETKVLAILDEVSAAKVQAKQQVAEQFSRRVSMLKDHAREKREDRQLKRQREVSERITQPPKRAVKDAPADVRPENVTKRLASASRAPTSKVAVAEPSKKKKRMK